MLFACCGTKTNVQLDIEKIEELKQEIEIKEEFVIEHSDFETTKQQVQQEIKIKLEPLIEDTISNVDMIDRGHEMKKELEIPEKEEEQDMDTQVYQIKQEELDLKLACDDLTTEG